MQCGNRGRCLRRSKFLKAFGNTPKCSKTFSLLLPLALLLLAGCKRDYEEFYFKGVVLGAEICNLQTDTYIIDIEYPEGIGDTLTYDGALHKNVVFGYKPPRRVMVGDTLIGVAYQYKSFAAFNCYLTLTYDLPEYFLLSVDEDPSVIEGHL